MFGKNAKKHKVTLPVRVVKKFAKGYAVMEFEEDGWHRISKFYNHSTSAYAALGRLTHRAVK